MYLKLLDEYEKEMVFDKGLKPGVVRHDARFEFALWLEKKAAQLQRAADEDYCQHDWSFPPELCPVCGKRVPVIRLRR